MTNRGGVWIHMGKASGAAYVSPFDYHSWSAGGAFRIKWAGAGSAICVTSITGLSDCIWIVPIRALICTRSRWEEEYIILSYTGRAFILTRPSAFRAYLVAICEIMLKYLGRFYWHLGRILKGNLRHKWCCPPAQLQLYRSDTKCSEAQCRSHKINCRLDTRSKHQDKCRLNKRSRNG